MYDPTSQFRYCIETMHSDLGLKKVYTDNLDNACDYCCDVSRDWNTEYSRVIDRSNNETLKIKSH